NGGDAGDDDDDDDDDEDDDEDADAIENRRGAIDGGIAGEVRDEHNVKITRSLKCPLVLYLETDEDLDDLCPHNPVMKRGTTVYIGIDKNTKLSLVFNQYCKFVNSKTPKKGKGAAKGTVDTDAVKTTDFEFLHCTLLDANQTVEASAMMKNDRIKVYRERSKERSSRGEVLRQQRESDRKYFRDLRQLLPNPSPEGMGCDIVLDCRGKVMDERGFSQNVLATTVRANSVLISKRCKWLGQKIFHEREDIRRRAEMTVPADEGKSDLNEEQEEDAEQVQAGGNNINNDIAGGDGSAAKVEDDEDEEPAAKVKVAKSPAKKAESHSSSWPNSIWVTLDHSPQAVKLLLEYCYTNRVPSLGQEAFLKASKYPNPKDVGVLAAKQAGPVPPFRKHEWPDTGSPTISLHLALAGIALAEEAHMPRLSLMCEIAASQLVDNKNVIDVLSACQVQQQKTGNRLPILRKAAMLDCIMANGSSGIDTLYANNSFRSNLEERGDVVIPSLLDGTVEVMPTNMNTKDIKRKLDKISLDKRRYFELNDGSDKNKRMMERVKRRKSAVVNRRMEVAYGPDKLALRMPSAQPKNIWRESYRRDPPPLNASGTSRGTKRKGSTRSTDGGAGASGSTRNVRRRQTRKKSNNLA
ncbi:hypothetical protein ACHAXR_003594, partial [Thalassiosira sp. AJA248-18]